MADSLRLLADLRKSLPARGGPAAARRHGRGGGTFAGLKANAALAEGLRGQGVRAVRVDNLAVGFASAVTEPEIIEALKRLEALGAEALRSPVSDQAIDGLQRNS